MHTITQYIESGILEQYVLGMVSDDDAVEVEKMAALHPEVLEEINRISSALEAFDQAQGIAPHATVKPLFLATIDYMQRLMGGEPPANPKILNEETRISDFEEWINRSDMKSPEEFEEIHVKLIAHTPQATTAIVWIKSMAPHEVHHNEFEKFLILEGTCDIIVGEATYPLVAGNYFQIPLHEGHRVVVTSNIPCKVILQRVAA